MKIITRFAPSPTGELHLGSIRTALYAWLFARNNGGEFILRIENTDLKRSTPEGIKIIIDSMNWLDLKWDKGPFFQTERLDRYNMIIDKMLATGVAYKCYCSEKRIAELRKNQISKFKKPRYDGKCRYNHSNYDINKPHVIRFANPHKGSVIFNDQIHGIIEFNNNELDDLIIRRSDGSPTYNLCVVIDDWDMSITHVIRGEDHINNTPRQINILKSLNAPVPTYAHVPVIQGDDGKKLSKRHGANSILKYRDDGYLPEALLNYLIRLGWSHGNQEIFNREEMIKYFSLKAINKSPSVFNIKKLMWLNHFYIKMLPVTYIAKHLQWHIKQINININNGPKIIDLVSILGARYKTLKDMAENSRYFYEEFSDFDSLSEKKYLNNFSYETLKIIRNKILNLNEWTIQSIRTVIQDTSDELKLEISKVGMPLRVAVTGKDKSPAIDITLYAIGKLRCIKRINKALEFIINKKLNRCLDK